MPMRWRRIIDSIAFIFAVGVAAWVKYGLDGSWYAAIALLATRIAQQGDRLEHRWRIGVLIVEDRQELADFVLDARS
jgi:hypothetical protein